MRTAPPRRHFHLDNSIQKLSFLLFAVCGFCACAPSRFVKPLSKGEQAVNLSLGGPLISYSHLVIPTPFVTATYGKGFDSTFTGFGSVNITSALYGNVQVELGAVKQLLKQRGHTPGVSFTPVINFIHHSGNANKFYPQLDVNAFWDYNRGRNFFYIGLSNWFELASERTLSQKQEHHWLLSPVLGQTFVRPHHNITIEAKIIAPNVYYRSNVVDYQSPFGKNGAFGLYFSYTKKF